MAKHKGEGERKADKKSKGVFKFKLEGVVKGDVIIHSPSLPLSHSLSLSHTFSHSFSHFVVYRNGTAGIRAFDGNLILQVRERERERERERKSLKTLSFVFLCPYPPLFTPFLFFLPPSLFTTFLSLSLRLSFFLSYFRATISNRIATTWNCRKM